VAILQGGLMIEITSSQNPRIKSLLKLKNKRERQKTQLFLIEGYREVKRATGANIEIDELYICPELFLGKNENALIKEIERKEKTIINCSKSVFEKISYRDRPDGLIALAKQKHLLIDELVQIVKEKSNPLFVVVESIEKPGNLGTILRSCDGAGVDGVIVCEEVTDIFNPNVVRASIGTLFTQPIIVASPDEILKFFKLNKIKIVATSPDAKQVYYENNFNIPIAIVMGSEQYGLSEKWLSESDLALSIPMLGVADSLNVATATTIMLYEALRQRTRS
jgi:RNA methyltransferase, TrmH family